MLSSSQLEQKGLGNQVTRLKRQRNKCTTVGSVMEDDKLT